MIIPSVAEIQSSRAEEVIRRVCKSVQEEDLESYLPLVNGLVSEGYDPVLIAAAFLKDQSAYHETPSNLDLVNVEQQKQSGGRRIQRGFIVMSVGREEGISPKAIVQAISSMCRMPPRAVGDIKIHQSYTAVQISDRYRERVVSRLDGAELFGTRLEVTYEPDYQSE
jgi:ATP-dependent RNA helicase DeaD